MITLEEYSIGNLTSWYRAAKSIIKAQHKYRTTQRSIRELFPKILEDSIQNPNVSSSPPEPDPAPAMQLPPPEPDPDTCGNMSHGTN
jgi:hypothetical protein